MADVRLSESIISKEGFLYKKGGIIKSWSRRYFVLTPQSLCYFRSELHERLEPLGRIFLSDIVSISTESTEKKKAFVFVLHTKKRAVLLQGANTEDRDKWVEGIQRAAEKEKEAENMDPFRKSLRRLTPGIKRITLFKDPVKGIGCTIKNVTGQIFVNRILEDGPIAETGVLRPGDELLDIHGVSVSNKTVGEVVEIIKQCPTHFLVTVRPIVSVNKALKADYTRIKYSSIIHKPTTTAATNGVTSNDDKLYDTIDTTDSTDGNTSNNGSYEYATVVKHEQKKPLRPAESQPIKYTPRSQSPTLDSPPSFEDVGNYDDEDEGDIPPPLPDWTEDALILVDPPPITPRFNIYKTNAHLIPIRNGKNPEMTNRSPVRRKKFSNEEYIRHTPSPITQHSPPNFPPPRPGKLLKYHSEDALDQIHIKSRPPVPPRLKRPGNGGFWSPVAQPRNRHLHEVTNGNKAVCLPRDGSHRHHYDDVEFNRLKYADLAFS